MKYAKNTKNMTITKRLLCLLLCFVMGVMCVLFSGCSLEDDLEGSLENEKLDKSFFENYVGGFNTVYASSQYGTPRNITDDLNVMLGYLTQGLLFNFGNIDKGTYKEDGKYENEKYGYGNSFPDSIRMLVYSSDGNTAGTIETESDKRWNWFFNPNLKETPLNGLVSNSTSSFSDWFAGLFDETDPYFQDDYKFPEAMNVALRIVLYEIMLGYEPLKLEVESGDKIQVEDKGKTGDVIANYYYIKIKDCSNKSIIGKYLHQEREKGGASLTFDGITYNLNVSPINQTDPDKEITEYLNKLAEEYKNSTLYNGLTKQNADKLIDYILKEIIGETVVNFDYSEFRNEPVNYRNYVSTIAYLIYSQTYDGSGDLWEYEYSSGSVKLSYKFTPAQRVKAMKVLLLNENGAPGVWSGDVNPTIITEVQAGFSAKPATFVRYYEGETFFGDDVEDQFAGRPYVEYQSVVIDPAYTLENAKTRGLELEAGFCFNFMTKNKNLKIAMKVRYFIYDSATGTGQLYEFQCDTVNFTDGATVYKNANGETCYENDFEASINTAELEKYNPSLVRHESTENDPDVTHFTVPFFDSSEIIRSASKREVSLSEAKNIAKLYKVIESEKGYGGLTVLDEKRVKTSFYEVVLDVIKSPEDTNTDYRFSMVLSNTVLSPGIW